MRLLPRSGGRETMEQMFGISEAEYHRLSTYNSEVSRGLIHTEPWRAAMRELQARYDNHRAARLRPGA